MEELADLLGESPAIKGRVVDRHPECRDFRLDRSGQFQRCSLELNDLGLLPYFRITRRPVWNLGPNSD